MLIFGCTSKLKNNIADNRSAKNAVGGNAAPETDSSRLLAEIQPKLDDMSKEAQALTVKSTDGNLTSSDLQEVAGRISLLIVALNEFESRLDSVVASAEDLSTRKEIAALKASVDDLLSTLTATQIDIQEKINEAAGGDSADIRAEESASLQLILLPGANLNSIARGTRVEVAIVVENVGNKEANSLNFPAMTAPWEIISNTCGSILPAAETCSVNVVVAAPGEGDLSIEYTVQYQPKSTSEFQDTSIMINAMGKAAVVNVLPAFPIHGSGWMDYIERGGMAVAYNAPDVACADEWGLVDSCFHAGEIRKVVLPSGSPGCSSLILTEALTAFKWVCDDSSGSTIFRTSGFRPGNGLQNLLSPSGWIPNKIAISSGGQVLFRSLAVAWWTNPIIELPNNSIGQTIDLTSSGVINILTQTRESAGYRITAPRVGLVTLPGATLRYSGSATANCGQWSTCDSATHSQICLINSIYGSYGWIEGRFDAKPGTGTRADSAVVGCYFSTGRMHQVTGINAALDGIWLEGAFNSLVTESAAAINGRYGLNLHYVQQIRVEGMTVANNGSHGIRVFDSYSSRYGSIRSYNNAGHGFSADFGFSDHLNNVLSAFNSLDGINLNDQWYNDFAIHGITVIGNGGNGMYVDDSSNILISQVLSVGNTGSGVLLNGFTDTPKIMSVVSAHNGSYGLRTSFAGPTNTVEFGGLLILGNNFTSDCSHVQGNGFSPACTTAATLFTGVNLETPMDAFVGKVSADSVNGSDVTGTATSATAVGDWLALENSHRVWGPDSAKLSNANGPCTTGTCRIWDLSLASNNSEIYNRSNSFASVNTPFVAGATCPAGAHGNMTASNVGGGVALSSKCH
jgi:hypothetical protein